MADNNLSAPSGNLVAATYDADIPLTRGVYVGAAGNLAVVSQDGQAITLVGLLAGVVYPFRVTQFVSAGTTATDVIAVY